MTSFAGRMARKALGLDKMEELLSVKQIAKLYYPKNDKSDERECIEEIILAAIDNGSIEISGGVISEPDQSKTMQFVPMNGSPWIAPDKARPEVAIDEWITLFDGLDCGSGKNLHWRSGGQVFLRERLPNGWPSKWDVRTRHRDHEYLLIPLISSSNYKSWADKPPEPTEPTEGSLISGWLGMAQQAEALGDGGAVASLIPAQNDLQKRTKVLQDWLVTQKEYKPGEVFVLPKGIKHKNIQTTLNNESTDKKLFDLTIDSFTRHFWQEQKIAELKRGR